MFKNRILFIICFLLLNSCSLLSPLEPQKTNTYLLASLPSHIPQKSTRNIILLVTPPITRPIYNTTQIAYTAKPFQLNYFSKNQWAETPSQMFLPLLISALQQTHFFRGVVVPPYMGKYHYSLSTQILKLQQDAIRSPNSIHFSIQVQLTRYLTQEVIATQIFSVQAPIVSQMPYGSIIAANQATADILSKITEFCLHHLQ